MSEHRLKIWRGPFDAIVDGRKTFEYRRDDRGFQVGDILELCLWDPVVHCYLPTGCDVGGHDMDPLHVSVKVTYIVRGPAFGIPDGYCVMSIERYVEST